jgi:hypothetical protein
LEEFKDDPAGWARIDGDVKVRARGRVGHVWLMCYGDLPDFDCGMLVERRGEWPFDNDMVILICCFSTFSNVPPLSFELAETPFCQQLT